MGSSLKIQSELEELKRENEILKNDLKVSKEAYETEIYKLKENIKARDRIAEEELRLQKQREQLRLND